MKQELLRKTKIVATIGPVSEDPKVFQTLVKAGLNVARLNMSHGDHVEHGKRVKTIRAVSKKLDTRVGILLDLAGPKIRIGDFRSSTITLKHGAHFTLTTEKCLGDEKRVYVNYKKLPSEVKKGDVILLDDGKIKLVIQNVRSHSIETIVKYGGEIRGRRGVNIPSGVLSIKCLTEKDKKDVAFGISMDVDFMGLSFVRSAKDVTELRTILNATKKGKGIAIIAKIETAQAVEDIDNIIATADGIMVARGDMAVEIGPEYVPGVQKMIVRKCAEQGKPVIVATQMLESMVHSATPTRAEVSDVANSILDGADAIMLSQETAMGSYPVEAVGVMNLVARQTETDHEHFRKHFRANTGNIVDSVSLSVVYTARNVDAKAVVALSESGFTTRMLARHRSTRAVLGMSPNEKTLNQMTLSFGCIPVKIGKFTYLSQVAEKAKFHAHALGFAKRGERIVIAAGVPFGHVGGTNLMLVHTV